MTNVTVHVINDLHTAIKTWSDCIAIKTGDEDL